ncbi:MAG: hypothetical protein IPN29_17500 [Saprospiraceae bacterium]|nr:hypothetical protein [Saprospiraceae bacterium]
MKDSVLLDTSFFIRLLNPADPLHSNAKGYYKYFLEHEIGLKISTISIAEYCVKGDISELPLRQLQIIPFNYDHALKTAEFARILFSQNGAKGVNLQPRAIIPNDSKLFAQASIDHTITHFVTSDARSKATYSTLKDNVNPGFQLLDIIISYDQAFGVLDL